MNKNTRNAEKKLRDCKSWKGESFEPRGRGTTVGRYAKRFTARTRRRLDGALAVAEPTA